MVNYFLEYNQTVMQILRNSGKDYNDFGRYADCQQMEQFNYILAYASPNKSLTNPLAVGMCVPQACKVPDLNDYKKYIVPAVNSILPILFDDVHGLGLHDLKLSAGNVTFVSSSELNEQATKFGFFSFFFIFVTISLVIMICVSTVISQKKMKTKRQEAIQKRKEMRESGNLED